MTAPLLEIELQPELTNFISQENYVILEVNVPASIDGSKRDVAKVSVKYNNMATKRGEQASDLVAVSFSNNNERVKDSINKVAYESAVEQLANAQTKHALELRDKGQVKEAEKTLTSNASFLDKAARLISSPKLSRQSVESKAEAAAVTQDKKWNI